MKTIKFTAKQLELYRLGIIKGYNRDEVAAVMGVTPKSIIEKLSPRSKYHDPELLLVHQQALAEKIEYYSSLELKQMNGYHVKESKVITSDTGIKEEVSHKFIKGDSRLLERKLDRAEKELRKYQVMLEEAEGDSSSFDYSKLTPEDRETLVSIMKKYK